jgi:site-specific recombinase XerC
MNDKGDVMNELAIRAGNDIKDLAAILSAYPTPDKWTAEQKAQAVNFAALLDTAQKMITAASVSGIDLQAEIDNFLSDTKSPHTRRAYAKALMDFKEWTCRRGLNPLELNAAGADSYIRFLKEGSRAAASIRRDIAVFSAFYTFLERYHDTVRNPVRGTRIRPPRKNVKETVIPTPADYAVIVENLPPLERAIVETLGLRGLRAGALPTLELRGGKYHGKSKGKTLKENNAEGIILPPDAVKAIEGAGLDVKRPFAKYSASAIERRVNRHMGKLYQAGKIPAAYSAHDFRHAFAKREYEKDKDIVRVSLLLGHSNIAITQTYLSGLSVEVK